MSYSRRHILTAVTLFLFSLGASAQVVLHGKVVNGTTNKPAAGDDVVLLKIDKGMSEEKRTKSNAAGDFTFDLPDSQFMRAVRVTHDNVTYFQPVTPGLASVTATVYQSAPAVKGLHQTKHFMVFEAQGNALQGYVVVDVQNDSQPPLTQPAFEFYLPDGATPADGSMAVRQGGMQLRVNPVSEGGNKYAIQYPLLPGQTHLEIIYTLPYTGTLKIQPRLTGAVDKFYVLTPKSMGFAADSASQYQAADASTVFPDLRGMDMHVASSTTNDQQLSFSIAGEGRVPQDTGQQSGGGEEADRPGGGMGIPNERPNPLSQGQWAFLGVLTLFLAGGAVIVFFAAKSQPAPIAVRNSASAPLLDALKEEMFQLEADRLHGKVNQQEYDAAKAVLDNMLHRTIKRKKQ